MERYGDQARIETSWDDRAVEKAARAAIAEGRTRIKRPRIALGAYNGFSGELRVEADWLIKVAIDLKIISKPERCSVCGKANGPPEFDRELLALVEHGHDEDVEVVLAVLRNYEGEDFIHRVCRAIIERLPSESELRSEVFVAIQNTGIVYGAYGLAEAYERKKVEIGSWLDDPSGKVREFALQYVARLDDMIAADRQRAEEEVALRKQRFDEQ